MAKFLWHGPGYLHFMNTTQLKGQIKQVEGKVKDVVGQVTGKPGLTMKGKAENYLGKMQTTLGDYQEKEELKTKKGRTTQPVITPEDETEGDI